MNKESSLLCGLGVILLLQGIASGTGAGLHLSTSRPYVMGYRVQGDFVLPVMGTLENGVFMEVNNPDQAYQQPEPPPLYYPPNRRDVDRFFANPETAAWVAGGKKAEPPPPPPAAPVVTGLVRLTGLLKTAVDGRLCLVVGTGAGETQYDLSSNEHFKETLPTLGAQQFRGHFTGVVTRGDPYPSFYVQSGWVEPL